MSVQSEIDRIQGEVGTQNGLITGCLSKLGVSAGGDTVTLRDTIATFVGGAYVLVSNTPPTIEALEKGGTVTVRTDSGAITEAYILQEQADGSWFITSESMNGIPAALALYTEMTDSGVTLPPGLYFTNVGFIIEGVLYTESLTINGYTGFGGGSGDTLTWNGGESGRTVVNYGDMWLVKVSDTPLTMSDFSQTETVSFEISSSDGYIGSVEQPVSDVVDVDGLILFYDICILSVPYDNFDADGIVFPQKGVYFLKAPNEDGYQYISSLTIPGYTGFGGGNAKITKNTRLLEALSGAVGELQGYVDASHEAVTAKGGTTSQPYLAENLPAAIESIPVGGSGGVELVLSSSDSEIASTSSITAGSYKAFTINHEDAGWAVGDYVILDEGVFGSLVGRVTSVGSNAAGAEFPKKTGMRVHNLSASAVTPGRYLDYYKFSK